MSKTANLPGSFFGPPTLVELIRHRAKYQPDDLAFGYLVDGDTDMLRMTNLDLDTRSRAIAAWLQEHGLTGERAMLLFPPGLDFIAAYLAVFTRVLSRFLFILRGKIVPRIVFRLLRRTAARRSL